MAAMNGAGNANLNAPAIPNVKNIGFMGGNIMLGGRGSDRFETNTGNDVIDGDLWLNVQLRAIYNDGTIRLVDSAQDLVADVFSDPQRLNPGNISIVRTIITPGFQGDPTGLLNDPNPAPAPPPDCNAAVPLNCDTVIFHGVRADYDISVDANRVVTVIDSGRALGRPLSDGVDTLRNIERLQFADVTIPVPVPARTVAVPNVVNLTVADATTAITAAQLTLGNQGEAFSQTIAIGNVVSQTPAAAGLVNVNTSVDINVAVGAAVPNVVGMTQAAATTALSNALLGVSVTTAPSTTVPIGTVISQDPAAFVTVNFWPARAHQGREPRRDDRNCRLVRHHGAERRRPDAGECDERDHRRRAGCGDNHEPARRNAGYRAKLDARGRRSREPRQRGKPGRVYGCATDGRGDGPSDEPGCVDADDSGSDDAGRLAAGGVHRGGCQPRGSEYQRRGSDQQRSGARLDEGRGNDGSHRQPGDGRDSGGRNSPGAQTLTTVTATLSSSKASSLTVQAFTGAEPSLTGEAAAVVSRTSGAITASIQTTRTNSLVFAVGADFSNPRTMTAGANQTKVNQFTPAVGDTYWVQRVTNPLANAGSTATISDTYGATTDQWNLALIEIRRQ